MTRRTALGTIAAGGLGSVAGCTGGGGGGSTATPTRTPQSSLQSQLDSVREATRQYRDPQTALEDGFKAGGPYVPGMGWHFQHPQRLQEAAQNGPDIERPPLLTYLDTDDGLTLGAVEYGIPSNAVDGTPDLFDDAGADATEKWHAHDAATHVFADGDGKRTPPDELTFDALTTKANWTEFNPPDDSLEPGDTVALNWGTTHGKEGDRTERVADIVKTHPSLTTLHVWVHESNPEGTFHPVNPKYMSDEGESSH